MHAWLFHLRHLPEALRDRPFLLLFKVEGTAPDFPAHFPSTLRRDLQLRNRLTDWQIIGDS